MLATRKPCRLSSLNYNAQRSEPSFSKLYTSLSKADFALTESQQGTSFTGVGLRPSAFHHTASPTFGHPIANRSSISALDPWASIGNYPSKCILWLKFSLRKVDKHPRCNGVTNCEPTVRALWSEYLIIRTEMMNIFYWIGTDRIIGGVEIGRGWKPKVWWP